NPEPSQRANRKPAAAPATLPNAPQTIPQAVPKSSPATTASKVRGTNARLAAMWTVMNASGAAGGQPIAVAISPGSKTAFQRQAATAPNARKPRASRRVARCNLPNERAVGASLLVDIIAPLKRGARSNQFPIRATPHRGEAVEPLGAVAKSPQKGR